MSFEGPFEAVTLIAAITMCVVMLGAVGWLYNGFTRDISGEDPQKRVRALTWMMRLIGLLQISVGLFLISQDSWANSVFLLLMGTLLLFGGGKWVRFTHDMHDR